MKQKSSMNTRDCNGLIQIRESLSERDIFVLILINHRTELEKKNSE